VGGHKGRFWHKGRLNFLEEGERYTAFPTVGGIIGPVEEWNASGRIQKNFKHDERDQSKE